MHDDVHHGSSMNMVKAYIGYHEDKVAIKWYRGSFDRGEEYCKKVVREAKESARVVRAFMNEVDTRGWTVRVAIPRITEVYSEGHDAERTVLVEPYLSHFESFYETADDIAYGSNRAYHRVIHALLHFSIWHTRGRGILADLKGSVDREMKEIILSAPSVIHHAEREHRHSGTGIFSFLSEHVCSRMCKETIRYRSHLRFSDDTSLW
ncbi:hypothetical protein BWQ96_00631 [Gracilariopsis chorda]|uniref:Alpha-type protein kinase domain-containing protein n=1 Tax=Gracilariopsis chorda TaxID=448386 RepID=A0A2V3J557_9FLOR|nr:hypothetical protein BWQ96_00631 [Gracilariopsis chorda]|eukprot:PXF49561.1 hypothetical protein BWQ96_00631 [Gracilariopsis chorda]